MAPLSVVIAVVATWWIGGRVVGGDRRRGRPRRRPGRGGGVERSRLGTSSGADGAALVSALGGAAMVVGGLLSLFALDTPARAGAAPTPAASLVPDAAPLEDLS